MLEHIILGFLDTCDMSGYDIKQFFSISAGKFMDASYGSIYPALKKLEEKKMITSKEITEAGKYKKVYSINTSGKEYFIEWLEHPIQLSIGKLNYLEKVFFFKKIPKEKASSLLKEYISLIDSELADLAKIKKKIEAHADYFEMSTLIYGEKYYLQAKDWCYQVLLDLN